MAVGDKPYLLVWTVLLSVVPLSFFLYTIPELITSDLVIESQGGSGEVIWPLMRNLGWALVALNVVVLLILWVPFRKGARWSLLPLWVYLLGYLVPAYVAPMYSTEWHSLEWWSHIFGEAIAGPGLARIGLGAIVLPAGMGIVLVLATWQLLGKRKPPSRAEG